MGHSFQLLQLLVFRRLLAKDFEHLRAAIHCRDVGSSLQESNGDISRASTDVEDLHRRTCTDQSAMLLDRGAISRQFQEHSVIGLCVLREDEVEVRSRSGNVVDALLIPPDVARDIEVGDALQGPLADLLVAQHGWQIGPQKKTWMWMAGEDDGNARVHRLTRPSGQMYIAHELCIEMVLFLLKCFILSLIHQFS